MPFKEEECVVCFTDKCNLMLFWLCRHQCVCPDCAIQLTRCPICRVPGRAMSLEQFVEGRKKRPLIAFDRGRCEQFLEKVHVHDRGVDISQGSPLARFLRNFDFGNRESYFLLDDINFTLRVPLHFVERATGFSWAGGNKWEPGTQSETR